MMFPVRSLSPLKKVGSSGSVHVSVCTELRAGDQWLCVSADMIYEDVQKDPRAVDADDGWSSTEFESYEEHSDTEAKPPPRSKVSWPGPGAGPGTGATPGAGPGSGPGAKCSL